MKIKIKTKSILSIMLALNLVFPMGYINNIDSYATAIDENEVVDTWIEGLASMPTSRSGLTSAVVDGKIYCIGGKNDSYLNTVEVYDPVTDSWETKSPMPTTRHNLTSTVVDDKIYVIGGYNGSYLNTVEVYNPATDSWETKASMPTSRSSLTSELVDGKIYCIGGFNSVNDGSPTNKIEVYDPATDSWETKASMPTQKNGFASAVVDGKIYCIGGHITTSYLNTVQLYNPATNSWDTKTSIPTTRGFMGNAFIDNKIYCIGGTPNGSSCLDTVEVYDPTTDSWSNKTSMPTSRSMLTSAVVDGKIYCIGGKNDSSYLNTVEAYVVINPKTNLEIAEEAVENAEVSRSSEDIENARELINQLPEGEEKDNFQNRLNAIVPNLSLDRKNTTANVDVYIKSENMLLMSLSTNSITFEDYSGVEEIEKTNALTININSSLAYDLNAYLVSEIQNADGSNKIDIDRLNIKANDENTYQEFAGINQKLTLKSNCNSGNDLTHDIDLKLKGDFAYEADIYKTVIKFEAEQK